MIFSHKKCISRVLSYAWHKGGAQVSLLFSNWCSCHFHHQCPRCHSKCICTRLCANGSVGLKRSCSQLHSLHIAILWHQKVFVPSTNKNHILSLAQFCPVIYRLHYLDVCTQARTFCLWHMGTHSKTLYNKLNNPCTFAFLFSDINILLLALRHCTGDKALLLPHQPAS